MFPHVPISAVFVVVFDTHVGNKVAYQYPVDRVDLTGVEFNALPSGVHSINSADVVVFKVPMLGVAAYAHVGIDNEEERNSRVVSVGVAYKEWSDGDARALFTLPRHISFLYAQVERLLSVPELDIDEYLVLQDYFENDQLMFTQPQSKDLSTQPTQPNVPSVQETPSSCTEVHAGNTPRTQRNTYETSFDNLSELDFEQVHGIALTAKPIVPTHDQFVNARGCSLWLTPTSTELAYALCVRYYGPNVFVLWKLLLLRARVLMYSAPPVHTICSRVRALSVLVNQTFEPLHLPPWQPSISNRIPESSSIRNQGTVHTETHSTTNTLMKMDMARSRQESSHTSSTNLNINAYSEYASASNQSQAPPTTPLFHVSIADIDVLTSYDSGGFLAFTTDRIYENKTDAYDVFVTERDIKYISPAFATTVSAYPTDADIARFESLATTTIEKQYEAFMVNSRTHSAYISFFRDLNHSLFVTLLEASLSRDKKLYLSNMQRRGFPWKEVAFVLATAQLYEIPVQFRADAEGYIYCTTALCCPTTFWIDGPCYRTENERCRYRIDENDLSAVWMNSTNTKILTISDRLFSIDIVELVHVDGPLTHLSTLNAHSFGYVTPLLEHTGETTDISQSLNWAVQYSPSDTHTSQQVFAYLCNCWPSGQEGTPIAVPVPSSVACLLSRIFSAVAKPNNTARPHVKYSFKSMMLVVVSIDMCCGALQT
eukprot:CFRG6931T1